MIYRTLMLPVRLKIGRLVRSKQLIMIALIMLAINRRRFIRISLRSMSPGIGKGCP